MTIEIRPLQGHHIQEADRIFRLAFGTFLGLPDPMGFAPGADFIGTRWRAGPHVVTLGAFDGDTLVGSNQLTRWGTFGFFGPLTVRPEDWGKGVAQRLLDETMRVFANWAVRDAGLFTFPHSPKHLALYQKYDFWPQHLTPLMARPVTADPATPPAFAGSRDELIAQARAVTEAACPGVDVSGEIAAVLDQGLGEIVTVVDGDTLAAFAVCHVGRGTEAGDGAGYIKFAAARPGSGAAFTSLIAASEAAAARAGAQVLVAGVNTACHDAYRAMLDLGFRTQFTGVAMQRGNRPGYLSPAALVLGDWR